MENCFYACGYGNGILIQRHTPRSSLCRSTSSSTRGYEQAANGISPAATSSISLGGLKRGTSVVGGLSGQKV
eukprot:1978221-Rhodomonas_salina.2